MGPCTECSECEIEEEQKSQESPDDKTKKTKCKCIKKIFNQKCKKHDEDDKKDQNRDKNLDIEEVPTNSKT